MNKELSNKITNINFILIIMIVILHASFDGELNKSYSSYEFVKGFYKFISTVADAAVPTFFCISGFLLFRNYKPETMKKKIISRIYSLVIPYFLWSGIFLIYYFALSKLNFLDYSEFDFSKNKNFLKYFLLASCAQTMWFVRVLIIYTVISPIIYMLFLKMKEKTYVVAFFLFIYNIMKMPSYSSYIFWLPIYLIAAYLGHKDFDLMKISLKKYNKIVLCIFVILNVVLLLCDQNSKIYYCYRMFSPLFIWMIYDLFKFKLEFQFKYDSFLIFCTHIPIIQILRKMILVVIGDNPIFSIVGYLLTIVITLIIITILAKIMKKYFNKIYNILVGGRNR